MSNKVSLQELTVNSALGIHSKHISSINDLTIYSPRLFPRLRTLISPVFRLSCRQRSTQLTLSFRPQRLLAAGKSVFTTSGRLQRRHNASPRLTRNSFYQESFLRSLGDNCYRYQRRVPFFFLSTARIDQPIPNSIIAAGF